MWSATLEDWKWTLGVNLMGVVHGVRSFVPRMLEQKDLGADDCQPSEPSPPHLLLSAQ